MTQTSQTPKSGGFISASAILGLLGALAVAASLTAKRSHDDTLAMVVSEGFASLAIGIGAFWIRAGSTSLREAFGFLFMVARIGLLVANNQYANTGWQDAFRNSPFVAVAFACGVLQSLTLLLAFVMAFTEARREIRDGRRKDEVV